MQKAAGTLSRPHGVCKTNISRRHLFQEKCLGICLANTGNSEDDITVSETRIVTDVCYDENKKLWQVVASIAKQHDYDDRFYLAENRNNAYDTILITVGNNLSKRIKTFNINRELI